MESPAMIDILLATYNGGRYLIPQIQSLQNQTFQNWHLWIHDDGSKDETPALLERFVREDSRITWIKDDVLLHSASENFMHLLRFSTADYTICCDQDDIWLEDKLQVLYDAIRCRDNSRVQAVYGNGYMYHCDRGVIQGRSVLTPPETLKDALFLNGGIQGCAILFNRKMREICLDRPQKIAMHDHLFTLVALTFGEFTFVDRYLMLYRRHSATVTDAVDGDFREKTSAFISKKSPILDSSHYEAIKSFYSHYRNQIPDSKMRELEIFFGLEHCAPFRRLWRVWKHHFRLYNRRYLLLLKMLVRPYMNH